MCILYIHIYYVFRMSMWVFCVYLKDFRNILIYFICTVTHEKGTAQKKGKKMLKICWRKVQPLYSVTRFLFEKENIKSFRMFHDNKKILCYFYKKRRCFLSFIFFANLLCSIKYNSAFFVVILKITIINLNQILHGMGGGGKKLQAIEWRHLTSTISFGIRKTGKKSHSFCTILNLSIYLTGIHSMYMCT